MLSRVVVHQLVVDQLLDSRASVEYEVSGFIVSGSDDHPILSVPPVPRRRCRYRSASTWSHRPPRARCEQLGEGHHHDRPPRCGRGTGASRASARRVGSCIVLLLSAGGSSLATSTSRVRRRRRRRRSARGRRAVGVHRRNEPELDVAGWTITPRSSSARTSVACAGVQVRAASR